MAYIAKLVCCFLVLVLFFKALSEEYCSISDGFGFYFFFKPLVETFLFWSDLFEKNILLKY